MENFSAMFRLISAPFRRNMKIRTLSVICIIILGYFLIAVKGFGPVAFVGWQPILKKSFDEQMAAYQRAYEAGSAVFPELQDKKLIEEKRGKVEPKKILEKMIQDKIIRIGANSLKISNLKKEINKEVSNSIGQESEERFTKSLKILYNWDLEEFKKFYAEPKVLKEIIARKLDESGQSFGEWFLDLTKKTKVRILIPSYHWDAGSGQVL